jgi:energy-coupling factor transporter transmembrane protein EcfT
MHPDGAAPSLHPATRIGVWILFAAAVAAGRWEFLAASAAVLAGWLALARPAILLPMLRRARWLLLSLVLVYAIATPGAPLPLWEGGPGLSAEGLAQGMLQAARIALMIGALALLLAATSVEELIAGLSTLLRPLAPLGVDAERVALRLALTLEYARRRAPRRRGDWSGALAAALEPDTAAPAPVRLPRIPFTWRDGAVAGAAALILFLGLA